MTLTGSTTYTSDFIGEIVKTGVDVSVVVFDNQGTAEVTEHFLVDPIDYDAELLERQRTHEAMEPVSGDQSNTVFGI